MEEAGPELTDHGPDDADLKKAGLADKDGKRKRLAVTLLAQLIVAAAIILAACC
ncbi:MAG: hypothetical protein ACYTFA_08315 [Planctomycetota bacterium]|jgi:hypothetical protein